jgi:hypothetical protein
MPDASFEWAQVTAHAVTVSGWADIARLSSILGGRLSAFLL